MPKWNLKLIARKTIAQNTIECIFEKPTHFTFKPGQFAGFSFINPPETDHLGINRSFTLASAPHDNFITVVTRVRTTAYKRNLLSISLGTELKVIGPAGFFTLHEEPHIPAIFIAGGVGVTPFYSMILHTLKQQPERRIFLFYSNQTPEDAIYLSELASWSKTHPNFVVVPTMTRITWEGEHGRISDTLLKKYLSDLNSGIFYICGGTAFVLDTKVLLHDMGVNDSQIKVEDFPDY